MKEINIKLFISIKNHIFIRSLVKREAKEKTKICKKIKYFVKIFIIFNYNIKLYYQIYFEYKYKIIEL